MITGGVVIDKTYSYDDFDIFVGDIDEKRLVSIGKSCGIKNLSKGTFSSQPFPVEGGIFNPNRFMVPLVVEYKGLCRYNATNIWFLIDTSSPYTCLTEKSLETIFGKKTDKSGYCGQFAIQDQKSHVECWVSKAHFKEVNILGANALHQLGLSIDVNWKQLEVKLIKKQSSVVLQDILLSDVHEIELYQLGEEYGPLHLSSATFPETPFPARGGRIFGENKRLLIPLVVGKPNHAFNVWFFVDTGAPGTFFSEKTLKTILGPNTEVSEDFSIAIQDKNIKIKFGIFSAHFIDINLLGSKAMDQLGGLSFIVDKEAGTFELTTKGMNPLAAKPNNNIEHLSNSQKILAVSNWLQWLQKTLNVPAVYSHEYWFDLAISPICEEIGDQLDSGLQEEPRICHLLNFIIELCGRIDNEHCGRERMVEMLNPLKQLLRCSEKPVNQQTRRMAQKAFTTLLGKFEPTSQFLLISRLFQLVYAREIQLSEEIFEPQVLAFLIDIYRQKCFGNSSAECKQLFRSQLAKFYAQLSEIVYEDPLIAVNFYSAVLLLISAQALNRTRISLLKDIGQSIVDKFRVQLRDWMELLRIRRADGKNECTHQSGSEQSTMFDELMDRRRQQTEDEALRLSMFSLQLDEAQRRMDIAFE